MMQRLLRHIKRTVWSVKRHGVRDRMHQLADDLLAGPAGSEPQLQGLDLAPLERWALLQSVLNQASRPVLHFLHVPKTGGTTLTAALMADARFSVVSVDGPWVAFLAQLQALVQRADPGLVFVRAHHPLSMVRGSGVGRLADLSISTIREPAAIHASNANMIIRRIQGLLNREKQAVEEQAHASRWLNIMGGEFDPSEQYALDILSAPEYRAEMGGVYATMFDAPGWRRDVEQGRLLCFDMAQLDELFERAFGFPALPLRRNVSTETTLAPDQIPSGLLESLVQDDAEIFQFLLRWKAAPEQIIDRLRALMEAG